uniref:NADH dehydrogenase subunit 6 n=1 Tax=Anoplodactylus australis TaxID=2992006 RepID=A0A9E7V7D1_9CHEL|nr:NADH dehydrogenase subunit 6 [Anoplodactylus australis]UZA61245.1 NADH dehydrogenase subunit 6 [Anoplodactylus australis]
MNMMTFFCFLLISITFTLFLTHPFMITMIIIAQTIMASIIIYYSTFFSLLSYTLILTFLGGMMVIFIYIASISSYKSFYKSQVYIFYSFLFFTPIMSFSLSKFIKIPLPNYNLSSMNLILSPMYSPSMFMTTLFMSILLTIMLIFIVKMLKLSALPLRTK